jgi:hypothetical protein
MRTSGRWLSTAFLIGCASAGPTDRPVHSPPDDPPETPLTPEQIVALLESDGSIPRLDRRGTLRGLDSEPNGIRDDVELYIDTHFPQLAAPARQLAMALQSSLLVDLGDAEALGEVALQIARAVDCVARSGANIQNTPDDPDVIDDLQAITANTEERIRAYLDFNAALDGTLSFPLEGEVCD